MDFKIAISILAIILVIVGYAPYIKDTIKGTTRPHVFSYFLWIFTTIIIFALQLQEGGGIGSWITFSIVFVMCIVFILSFKNGKRDIRKIDYVFLGLGIIATLLWIIAKQPILSIILLSTVDILGFAPTVRKSWYDPWSETLFLYIITALRHGLAIIALVEINFVTALFPISWTLANALFSLMLIVRRKTFNNKSF